MPEVKAPASVNITSVKIPHLQALDAMRGVFCIVVIIMHFYLTLPQELRIEWRWLTLTPLRFGATFLIIFYILSGFVLALPYGTPAPPTYRVFIIKRMCRLYIPYAAIMVMAFILYALTGASPAFIDETSFHIGGFENVLAFTPLMLIRVLVATGLRKDLLLDPATWTLVQEIRVSFFFPLLILLCRRSWVWLPVATACYVFVYFAQNTIGRYVVFPWLMDDYLTSWLTTIYITPCFIFGILLAKHRNRIHAYMVKLATPWRVALWIFVAINFSFVPNLQVRQPFTESGAVILIMLALSSDFINEIAAIPIIRGLGQISYSVYLVHLPILFALKTCLQDRIGLGWILALCFTLTFPVAMFTQRFIEVPARQLGKKLTQVTP